VSDFSDYKARVRDSWEEGDYRVIAESTLPAAQALLDACAISAGQEVLDVAAGNGNLALLAAREGAAVVASDLTPGMVAMGQARTDAEGYDVEWCVADVEALPFDDARFDCCASVFGAMFAPRPELAASEMFRVVRPGGTVGLVSWTPDGFQGRVFAVGNKYAPMPEGVPVPSHWGDEDVARERLSGLASSLAFERHTVRHEFDHGRIGVRIAGRGRAGEARDQGCAGNQQTQSGGCKDHGISLREHKNIGLSTRSRKQRPRPAACQQTADRRRQLG